MGLGTNIYRLRTGRGLSQGELAEALQVSRQSISKWEVGGAVPDLDKLLALSDLFGVTLDELVRGDVPEAALEIPPAKHNEQVPATTQPAAGESSAGKTALIVIFVILGLWLLFSIFMSPSSWPGLLVLIVIGGLGFALWTRIREERENPAEQKERTSGKGHLGIIILIAVILLLPVLGLANSLPAAPVYAKAGKESTLTPQEYPGVRFATCSGQQRIVSYVLVNETGEPLSYDASEQRIEIKKNGTWYQLKKRDNTKHTYMGLLQAEKGVHIQISCEELYGNLGAGEYRVLLQVYPLSESGKAQWIAEEFTIQAAFQLP